MTLPLATRLTRRTDRRVALATGLRAAGGTLAWLAASADPLVRHVAAQGIAAQAPFAGYGPVVPDPSARPIIDLPPGFQYRILMERGDRLSNGDPRPTLADGMASFALPGGRTLLVMNHENAYRNTANQTPVELADVYDREAAGGTTALIVRPDLSVEHSYATSAGTVRNCAGGVTPWGTWLTCEETEHVPGSPNSAATLRHGYTFEVLPYGREGAYPQQVRLPGLGRFNKEAAVVDPGSGIVYLTEDHAEGLLYRFVPNAQWPRGFGSYLQGGRLEAMRIEQLERTWAGAPQRRPFRVGWVPIDDPDAIEIPTRLQGAWKGAHVFSRGEGMWWSGLGFYFTCTSGGQEEGGQVWRFVPSSGMIELLYEVSDRNEMEGPDNITVHPGSGDLFVCEDGPGTDFIRVVTAEGRTFPFARVAMMTEDPRHKGFAGVTDTAGEVRGSQADGRMDGEDAGACFSPDGRVLFFNIQAPSMTIAVTGPFRQALATGGSALGARAMSLSQPPAAWLPPMGDAVLARGAELGYSPTEVAALRHLGFDF
jgi:uncharacterized protein